MASRCRNLLPFFCVIFLWKLCKIRAYLDICESNFMTAYCDCNSLSYRESTAFYRVSCIILQNISRDDPIWRSIGNGDTITYLKLYPRLPLKLEYIPSEELKRMHNLKHLKFQEGSFGVLKPYTISGFENLVELEMSGNEITAMEAYAISDLPKLKKLILSENRLEEILEYSMNNLLELEILFLDRNNISRIESCAFCTLQNLKELDLWGNQISDLTEYTFRGLRYLTRLDLYKNKIKLLNDKVFHTMPRLGELDMKENLIHHISPRAFFGLEKLQVLNLASNRIKVVPGDAFQPLLSLRSLDLYRNEIEILPGEVIRNIKNSKDEFFYLGFKDNPLKCDCAMQWVSSYINENLHLQFKRELEGAICHTDDGTNHTIVHFLKTADCKSSTIKPRAPIYTASVTVKSTDIIPIELQSQKSKAYSTAASMEKGPEDTYVSDSSKTTDEDSGCDSSRCGVCFIVIASMMTLLFARNRITV